MAGVTREPEFLTDLLLFHAIPGTVVLAEDIDCSTSPNLIVMANGDTAAIVCEDLDIFIAGIGNEQVELFPKIITTDVPACNGVVHVIDQVLLPDLDTMLGTNTPTETPTTSDTTSDTTGEITTAPTSVPTTTTKVVDPTATPTTPPTGTPTAGPTSDPCPALSGDCEKCLKNNGCLFCRGNGLCYNSKPSTLIEPNINNTEPIASSEPNPTPNLSRLRFLQPEPVCNTTVTMFTEGCAAETEAPSPPPTIPADNSTEPSNQTQTPPGDDSGAFSSARTNVFFAVVGAALSVLLCLT